MLKEVNGLWHMTGTGENSTYPCALWNADTGFHVGLRLDLNAAKGAPDGVMGATLYMRVQFFNEDGSDATFNYEVAAKYLHHMELRLAGPKHMSGAVGGGLVNTKADDAHNAVTAYTQAYIGLISKIAKKHYLTRLNDDAVEAMIKARFAEFGVADKPAPKPIADIAKDEEAQLDEIEKQLGSGDAPFDFTKLLGGKKG